MSKYAKANRQLTIGNKFSTIVECTVITLKPFSFQLLNFFMNKIKRFLGIIWMLLGPATIFILVAGAINNIDVAGKTDISKPLPWLIIISIFTPVAIGLMIFGWYSWKGNYNKYADNNV